MQEKKEQHITTQTEFDRLISNSRHVNGIVADKIALVNSRHSNVLEDCEINHLIISLSYTGTNQSVKLINCKIIKVDLKILVEDGFLEIDGDSSQITQLLLDNSKYHAVKSSAGVNIDILQITGGVVNLSKISGLEPNKVKITRTQRVIGELFGKNITIHNCTQSAQLNLQTTSVYQNINLEGIQVLTMRADNIDSSELNIKIIDSERIQDLEFKNSKLSSLVIENTKIDRGELIDLKLNEFSCELFATNFIHIGSSNVSDKSYISRFHLNSKKYAQVKLTVDKVDFSTIIFSDKIEVSELKLSQVKIKDSLDIQDLDFKQATLNNIDFSACNKILLLRSSLSEVSFTNIQWPAGNKTVKLKELNLDESWEQREVYRQLKENHLKSSNTLDAKLFDRNELDVYLKLITKKRGNNIFRLTFWENFGDYLILASNKYLGGWGQNFWAPLFWLLFVHLLLFSMLSLVFSFDFEPWIPFHNSFSGEATKEGLAAYLFFLNPLHRFIIDGEVQYSIIDFLIRISSGYFIFYFLRATRKYH